MINDLLQNVDKIYIAYGATDFRKQTSSLCGIVRDIFKMNPYDRAAYIFCNKKRCFLKKTPPKIYNFPTSCFLNKEL